MITTTTAPTALTTFEDATNVLQELEALRQFLETESGETLTLSDALTYTNEAANCWTQVLIAFPEIAAWAAARAQQVLLATDWRPLAAKETGNE